MDHESARLVPQKGMTIVGSDGETVGEIDLVETTYVIVRKGLFPQDYYIAVRDIVAQDEDGTLRLAIPAQEALERGLGNPMVGAEGEHTATMEAAAHAGIDMGTSHDETLDTAIASDVDTSPEGTADTEVVADVPEPAMLHADVENVEVEGEPMRDDTHRTITLSEEEVSATPRPVERGVVRVQKQVIEENVTLEVPLVDDEVHVTRRRVDREITDEDTPFEERHIEMPLRGQGVEIEKRAHIVAEVDIDKTAHQEIRDVTETVRKERARVEGEGVVEVSDDTKTRLDEDQTIDS